MLPTLEFKLHPLGLPALNTQQQPLVVVLIAVAVGIVADQVSGCGLAVWWSACAGGWLIWFAMRRLRFDRWSALPLLLAAAAVGAAWHHCCWCLFAENDISRFARGPVEPAAIEAQVVSGPRLMPAPPRDPLRTTPLADRTRVEVRLVRIRDGRDWKHVAGTAMLLVTGGASGRQGRGPLADFRPTERRPPAG